MSASFRTTRRRPGSIQTALGTYHGDAMDGTATTVDNFALLSRRSVRIVGRLRRDAADRRTTPTDYGGLAPATPGSDVRADVRAGRARQLDLLDRQLQLCRLQ